MAKSNLDKAIDRAMKSVLEIVDYDIAKSLYGGGWDGEPEHLEPHLAEIRTAFKRHIPKLVKALT